MLLILNLMWPPLHTVVFMVDIPYETPKVLLSKLWESPTFLGGVLERACYFVPREKKNRKVPTHCLEEKPSFNENLKCCRMES